MAKLKWDQTSERVFETGTKQGILFVQNTDGTYKDGVAWNGLTAVTESPDGAEPSDIYADDSKYLTLRSAETFGGTIEAYTYPDEFAACDGSATLVPGVHFGQQSRSSFGFSYKTVVGNDSAGNDFGYKIHLVYGASCSPSEKSYQTINDSPEAITFSWEFETTPIDFSTVTGFSNYKPTSCITIDSTKLTTEAGKAALTSLEEMLYGTDSTESKLPLPTDIITMFGNLSA